MFCVRTMADSLLIMLWITPLNLMKEAEFLKDTITLCVMCIYLYSCVYMFLMLTYMCLICDIIRQYSGIGGHGVFNSFHNNGEVIQRRFSLYSLLNVFFSQQCNSSLFMRAAAAEFSLLILTQHGHNYPGPFPYLRLSCN